MSRSLSVSFAAYLPCFLPAIPIWLSNHPLSFRPAATSTMHLVTSVRIITFLLCYPCRSPQMCPDYVSDCLHWKEELVNKQQLSKLNPNNWTLFWTYIMNWWADLLQCTVNCLSHGAKLVSVDALSYMVAYLSSYAVYPTNSSLASCLLCGTLLFNDSV